MNGYRLALNESVKFVKDNMLLKLDTLPKETLFNLAKTSLSSKFIGAADKFSEMVVTAVESVKVPGPAGKAKYPVAQINILKSLGRAGQGMPTRVQNAKIALLDFDLKKYRVAMGV